MFLSPRRALAGLFGLTACCLLRKGQGQQCALEPSRLNDRQIYRIGVLANRGIETAYKDFNRTAEYLTRSIGDDFDPPISFEIAPVAFGKEGVIDRFTSGQYDFVFANPTVASCVDSEVGTHAIASMIARRRVNSNNYDLTEFGGVIFARADNDEVNSIYDIVGKRTACISITGLGRYVGEEHHINTI